MKDNPGAITAAGSIWRCERARREAPGRADGHKRENGHLIEMILMRAADLGHVHEISMANFFVFSRTRRQLRWADGLKWSNALIRSRKSIRLRFGRIFLGIGRANSFLEEMNYMPFGQNKKT